MTGRTLLGVTVLAMAGVLSGVLIGHFLDSYSQETEALGFSGKPAVVEEARVPRKRMPSQTFSGTIRVQPLLTPDRRGAAFCRPVLSLIRSARQQLWFHIPYITPVPERAGRS